jgi:hypothetical protein
MKLNSDSPVAFAFILIAALAIVLYQNGGLYTRTTTTGTVSTSSKGNAGTHYAGPEPEVLGAQTYNYNAYINSSFLAKSNFATAILINKVEDPGSFASKEYIVLRPNNIRVPINISGWSIRSDITGRRAWIGLGENNPYFSPLSSIYLNDGERAIVSSDSSKIKRNFKENMCTGYLEDEYNFTPGLDLQCRYIDEDDLPNKIANNEECSDYITSLDRCEIPNTRDDKYEDLNKSCKEYIKDNLNYQGCVAQNQFKEDFSEGDWRIYLNSRTSLWGKNHDVLRLLDGQGKTVDVYSY